MKKGLTNLSYHYQLQVLLVTDRATQNLNTTIIELAHSFYSQWNDKLLVIPEVGNGNLSWLGPVSL